MVIYQCYGLVQARLDGQPGLVEIVPASGDDTRLRYLPTQIIYDSMTSFHYLLPTTKQYSICQHKKVNQKN